MSKIDPINKIVCFFCIQILMLFSCNLWIQVTLYLLFSLAILKLYYNGWKYVFSYSLFPFVFAVVQCLFLPKEYLFLFTVACRWANFCLSSLVLIKIITQKELIWVMSVKCRIPYSFSYGVSLALQLIPILSHEMRIIAYTYRTRFHAHPYRLHLIKTSFTNALRKVETISTAMELRNFRKLPTRTSYFQGQKVYWVHSFISFISIVLTIYLIGGYVL